LNWQSCVTKESPKFFPPWRHRWQWWWYSCQLPEAGF
jgi:hypothetical protein